MTEIKPILEKIHSMVNPPLTFVDIETTGLDNVKDDIIQIYLCKYDGKEFIEHNAYYCSDVQMSKEAYEKHGMTNEDLEQYPPFSEDAQMIYETYLNTGVVICGFNSNHFDIPFIIEKMIQCDITKATHIHNNKTIDVIKVYRELFPNTLGEIHKRLVGCDIENSHDAKNDIVGTIAILDKLIEHNPNVTLISESETLDIGGFFKREGNEIKFNKGKYRGMNVLKMDKKEVLGFLRWMTNNNNISVHSKMIANKLIEKIEK